MPRKPKRFWIPDAEIRDIVDGPPPKRLGYEDFDPWQKLMARTATFLPYSFLAAEMGLGKTGAALGSMRFSLDKGVISRWLVVAPLKVTTDTWPDEMWTWDFVRDMEYSVIAGTEAERLEAARSPAPFHFINRENYAWLYKKFKAIWRWDGLVYDEASRLKAGRVHGNPRKDGKKHLTEYGSLVESRHHFKKVIELGGTPCPEGLYDLYGPISILDGGKRLGRSKTEFEERWFVKSPYNYEIKPRPGALEEIMSAIEDIMISLKQEDYMSLPPVVQKDVWVTLSRESMETYKRLEKDFLLEEHDVEAVNKGVLVNKLLQLSNGSIYNSEKEAVPFHDEKIAALQSIVNDSGGRPILVAYEFKFDLDRIKKAFPKARVFGESDRDMADWNQGKIDMLLLHPASAGHGMNFQHGGNIAVWYGLTWSLELYQQFNKRLERRGQKADKVFMYRILARGTWDERQAQMLIDKGATQDTITDWVRVRRDQIEERLANVGR